MQNSYPTDLRRHLAAWLCIAGLLLAAGCTQSRIESEVAAKNDANIKRVANLYNGYQLSYSFQGPKEVSELKEFVRHGLPAQNVKMMGIDSANIDAIFVSERDGKPFKIRPGVVGGVGAVNALVFESDGVAGKRLVAFNGPMVEEVDEARYNELWDKGGVPLDLKDRAGVGAGYAPPGAAGSGTGGASSEPAK